jgi:hypothetical protein
MARFEMKKRKTSVNAKRRLAETESDFEIIAEYLDIPDRRK